MWVLEFYSLSNFMIWRNNESLKSTMEKPAMSSLAPHQIRHIGRSLTDLASFREKETNKTETDGKGTKALKEKLGPLRRAFSSMKKKRRGISSSNSPSPSRKETVRAVRSSPISDSCYFDSSPASDLSARRSVFSRKHYGSVELLTSCEGEGTEHSAGRFRVETGEREGEEISSPLNSPIHLENPEFQTRWYFKYFLGKLHQNYVGLDSDKEPFMMSVVVTDANNHNVLQYRAVLWRKTGAVRICLPYQSSKPMTVKSILSHFNIDKTEKGPKEIFDPEIQKELLVLEEQEGSVNFKFGVLYAKDGQTSDDEMFSNDTASPAFHKFVNLLGERIKLKGWDRFKGGLDVKTNTTGEESVYTVYEGHEIMFHVSDSLPHSKDNKQQVERKRHIGNDIVNIVFVDCDDDKAPSFRPAMMKTHFTHIFAVVTYSSQYDYYRLIVYSEESVPLFGPPLPCPPVFTHHPSFRDFLLVKLINGEKAAFNVPVFAQKRERTLDMLIRSLYQEHLPDVSKNNMLNRRAFSDVIPDVHGSRRKEEARQTEFVRIGQTLKLKTILKGDAPTSMITTGLLKREPWEPQQIHSDFPHNIICGDSWGDKLVLCTDAGTMVLEEGLQPRLILDKSFAIKQISVIEAHGILLFRADKGKDCKIYVFRLMDFEGYQESMVKCKADYKDHKIEKTRGCHLYSLSRPCSSHLRMVVAIGKRLLLYTWKHSAAWSAWCPTVDIDTVDGFIFVRELQAFDTPSLITIVEGKKGDNQICIGYKNQFDLINEKNGDTLQLYKIDNSKQVNLVSAVDIYEDDESELILCYNHVSHFQRLREETFHDFDFQWNSEPLAIVCAFPYIMAFTPDTIEIRLMINGNLVHTMTMPDLVLITSKCDIYFASTASCSYSPTEKVRDKENTYSPPPSPQGKSQSTHLYKIPLSCLAGQISTDKVTPVSTQPQAPTLLAPIMPNGDKSPSIGRRSPLTRTKRSGPANIYLGEDKDRHDSSSSDSGILSFKPNDMSPPVSPMGSAGYVEVYEQETDLL